MEGGEGGRGGREGRERGLEGTRTSGGRVVGREEGASEGAREGGRGPSEEGGRGPSEEGGLMLVNPFSRQHDTDSIMRYKENIITISVIALIVTLYQTARRSS